MAPKSSQARIEDFQQMILRDLNFEAFRVLGLEIGDEKAVEIFKPHMRNSGTALVVNAQKLLGLTVQDIESMAVILAFITRSLWMVPGGDEMRLTRDGIEWQNPEGCYLKDAPYCLRRMVCDDANEGLFTPVDQDFASSNRCYDKGDHECRVIFYRARNPSMDWSNQGSKDTPIPIPQFDDQKQRQFGILALGELWLFPTQALIEWKGAEAATKLKEAIRPLGRKWGRELVRVTGEEGKDITSLLSILDTYNTIMGQETKTIYTSPVKNETEVIECPFSVAPTEMGALCGEAIGAQCESFHNGICDEVCPEYEVRFQSKMCTGGHSCHRALRKKLAARAAQKD